MTSYESILDAGRFHSSDTVIGSSVDQFESTGATLSQPLSELGGGSQSILDREWEQWQCIHETTDSELVIACSHKLLLGCTITLFFTVCIRRC